MRVTADLRSALARLGLDDHAELLAPYATVELGLVPDREGMSQIGGSPDLPPDTPWPSHRWRLAELEGWPAYARAEVDLSRGRGEVFVDGDHLVMPLPFVLQIDLASLDPLDKRLPERGVLAFFAAVTTDLPDPLFAKRVAAHVAYFPDAGTLRMRPHPPTADDPPANPIRLRGERVIRWEIPFEDQARLEAELPADAYAVLAADRRHANHALLPTPAEECVGPMPPFGDVALLRVHDDPLADFRVGDASWLTFTISELDLRARRFEAARASVFIG